MFVTQRLSPQTPHDEIFCAADTCACNIPISVPQHHAHKASSSNSNEQAVFYYPIKNASARYSICTRRERDIKKHLSGHFLLLIFQKLASLNQRGNQHALFYTGDPSLSLFPFCLFLLPFHHHHLASFPSHHHGARSTADGSRVMDGVECKCGTS